MTDGMKEAFAAYLNVPGLISPTKRSGELTGRFLWGATGTSTSSYKSCEAYGAQIHIVREMSLRGRDTCPFTLHPSLSVIPPQARTHPELLGHVPRPVWLVEADTDEEGLVPTLCIRRRLLQHLNPCSRPTAQRRE